MGLQKEERPSCRAGEIILSRHSGDIVNPESRALPPETTRNTLRGGVPSPCLYSRVWVSEDYKTPWLFLTFLLPRNVGRALGKEPGGRHTWVRAQQAGPAFIRCLLFRMTTLTHGRGAQPPTPTRDQRSASPGTHHATPIKMALSFVATRSASNPSWGLGTGPSGVPSLRGTATPVRNATILNLKTVPPFWDSWLEKGFSHSRAAALLAD